MKLDHEVRGMFQNVFIATQYGIPNEWTKLNSEAYLWSTLVSQLKQDRIEYSNGSHVTSYAFLRDNVTTTIDIFNR